MVREAAHKQADDGIHDTRDRNNRRRFNRRQADKGGIEEKQPCANDGKSTTTHNIGKAITDTDRYGNFSFWVLHVLSRL